MRKPGWKHIALRITLLLGILVVLNGAYKFLFFEKDLQEYSPSINLVRDVPLGADIIYMGESSNMTFREEDLDKRKISDFISDYYPGLGFYDITIPAAHAGVFKVLLRQLPEESQVGCVIVTMNLRSFNAQWIYSNLETSLQKSLVLLRPYPPLVDRFLLSFKAYNIKTDEERTREFKRQWVRDKLHFPYEFPHKNVSQWNHSMANLGIRDTTGALDQARTELACHYIKAYGFQIDTLENPRIADFDDIVELVRERGWHLVFILMAENTEKAEQLVGKDLLFLMNQNRELLINYYRARGVTVVDNLSSVEDAQFIDQTWTTEHYGEKGRKTIARRTAEELKKSCPDQFKDAGY